MGLFSAKPVEKPTDKLAGLKRVQVVDEDGVEILNIVQMIQYLDGWVVLTERGFVYTNASIAK